jgi:hypothetical protein
MSAGGIAGTLLYVILIIVALIIIVVLLQIFIGIFAVVGINEIESLKNFFSQINLAILIPTPSL